MINLENIDKVEQIQETAPSIGYQKASVCVPVTVIPFANVGDTSTFCCKDPIIQPGTIKCEGEINGTCSFTISQEICVAVPINFGAISKVGDLSVNPTEASNKDICTECKI
ncbi:MAG: hypothetical protein KFW09_06485 [Oscillospiraceae bacterium]|nr:hypothetical protein [Oscillospiraceae bacterium]